MTGRPVRHIVHIGRYHRKDDIRIFCKECVALKEAGYQVSYMTSDIYGDQETFESEGIRICFYSNASLQIHIRHLFLKGIFVRSHQLNKIAESVIQMQPDVIHVHEYEALPLVWKILKRNRNIKLVYDIHEDNPRQIGEWYRKNHGKLTAWIVEKIVQARENGIIKRAVFVIVATDYLKDLAAKHNQHVYTVKNYPKSEDVDSSNEDLGDRDSNYCYCGGITQDRGITLLVKNSDAIQGRLLLAGNAQEAYIQSLREEYPKQWKQYVSYQGYLTRRQVKELYCSSVVGLCVLQNHPNYIHALPIKLFEYMAAGIPVVISDFPLWKQIVEDAHCGITVNPYQEEEVVKAVNCLLLDRELAKKLGDQGKRAVREKYHWEKEAENLIEAYRSMLSCVE